MFRWVHQVVHSLLLPFNSNQSQSVDNDQSPVQHWLELTCGVTDWTRFDAEVEDRPGDGDGEGSVSSPLQLSSQRRDSIDDQASNRAAIRQWQEMVSAAIGRDVVNGEHTAVNERVIGVDVDGSHDIYDIQERLIDFSDENKTAYLADTQSSGNLVIHDRQAENSLVDMNNFKESPAPQSSSMDPSGHQVVSQLPTLGPVQDGTQLHRQTSERFIPGAHRPESVQATTFNVMRAPANAFGPSVVQDPEWTPLPTDRNSRSTLKGLPSRQIQCRAGSFSDSLWSD